MDALAPYRPAYKLDNHGRVMELALENQSIDESILGAIEKLDALRILNLNGTNINDDELVRLTVLKRLQFLRLDETPVTDKGIILLDKLDDLRLLALKKCKAVSNECVTDLKGRLPGLKVYR